MTENNPEVIEKSDKIEIRRGKRDKFREIGIDPYPPRFEKTFSCSKARESVSETEPHEHVAVAGRIRSIREHGKSTFATIEDESGKVQIYFRKNDLTEKYDYIKFLDIGDFIGVKGYTFRTRMGEPTVHAEDFEILSKSLQPLPSEWYGLENKEIRYRKRYLDLISNPEVREVFKKRAVIVSSIRQFLIERGFMEVETPMMQALAGGAAAKPFMTHHNALDIDLYLRIAPELYLKRLIVGGFEKVFELNRNFRNEGMDRNHNPEFTMLEIYQAYADYNSMMDLTEELVRYAAEKANAYRVPLEARASAPVPLSKNDNELPLEARAPSHMLDKHFMEVISDDKSSSLKLDGPWQRIPFFEAIRLGGGPDLKPGDAAKAEAAVKECGIETESREYADHLDSLFERFAEPHLAGPVFITDYPTALSPLAKRKPGEPELVERFEAYVRGMEIANAFSELNDPDDQEARFRAQSDRIDEDYVSALRAGMPPAGGLGIGIDRLVMILTGAHSIRDVILFPTMRPDSKSD
ncbi:MAG: lysine--tRNA ligase [Candidatus Hydrogenedentes bacterium CG07_land_8_20_14_0_80_42_17]|nr:MAG: lysine--tRNA ligase [Candidatus Hydrogenedentes bacterium CG07_land_8_20_14_0_80_42_17]